MRVVVTGASGYLGSSLCRGLLQEGHTVRALVRRSSDLSSLPTTASSQNFELAFGDVIDLASLLAVFSGCDVLFHAAAVVEHWVPNPSVLFTVNVEGLGNVLRAFRETSSMQKMVYTSSFFALGPTDGCIGNEMQDNRDEASLEAVCGHQYCHRGARSCGVVVFLDRTFNLSDRILYNQMSCTV